MAPRPSMGSCERPCCRQATTGVERSWRNFFIKVRTTTIEDKKLNLPLKFARKFGDELSDVAKLIAPNGLIWKVGLTKGETIWLDNGWQELVEYYSVCNGWFLQFNYLGMSNFNIFIFDETVFEIGYPCIQPRRKQEPSNMRNQTPFNEDEIEEDDDDFVDMFGSTPRPSSSKGTSSKKRDYLGFNKRFKNPASAEKRKLKQDYQGKGKNCKIEDLGENDSDQDGIDLSPECEAKIFISNKFDVTLAKIYPGSKKAVDAAMECKPQNPAFLVILGKSYIRTNLLHVPSAFAMKYLRNISDTIKVEDCYGGEWIIHTFCSWRGWSLVLRGGWDEFFSDNDMQNGDVCLFELIQERDVVLKVLVFHAYLE